MGESAAVAELVAEKRKLKKSLFRFDMIFFTICAIVALDTIEQSSSYGAQAIFWLALLAFFALLVIASGVQHGFHGSLGGFFPTDTTILIGVIGVIVFQWIGFELQTNASEEMDNPQRDIPRAVYASGLISFLGYAIPIICVILLLSTDQPSNLAAL